MNLKLCQTYKKKYQQELESVISFWEKNSIDREYGGFFTFLDRNGGVYDTDKFMWLEWREVYMFSTLYSSYRKNSEWLEYAQHGFEFLTAHGKDGSGMYYFALNRKGEPVTAPYNIFSEAFAVMGSAALFKATHDQRYKTEACSAMNHYLARIDHPKGQWDKTLSAQKKRLSLGPYMILANLGTVMKDCVGIDDFETDVADAVDSVLNIFWNKTYRVLFENINTDFSFDLDSCEGRHLNPGHGLESAWFVLKYAEQSNRSDLVAPACAIIKSLLEFGWDEKYGGLYYFMDVLGKPHIELQWDMKLWWVHNEAMLACLYAYRMTKDAYFWTWFEKIDVWSFEHFKDAEYPEWYGYLNRSGQPTHTLKGGKWKGFFHLPRFLLFSIEQFSLMEKG